MKLELLVQEGVENICNRLRMAKKMEEPANMSLLYRSLTADVICEYAFADSYDFLNKPEESSSFFGAFIQVARIMFVVREIPGANRFLSLLGQAPSWAQPRNDGMLTMMRWQKVR